MCPEPYGYAIVFCNRGDLRSTADEIALLTSQKSVTRLFQLPVLIPVLMPVSNPVSTPLFGLGGFLLLTGAAGVSSW